MLRVVAVIIAAAVALALILVLMLIVVVVLLVARAVVVVLVMLIALKSAGLFIKPTEMQSTHWNLNKELCKRWVYVFDYSNYC